MTIKKTPKAKSQKTVSRAVKEAGFKNIKEAKETLHKYKEELANNCCNTGGCEADLKTKPDTVEYLNQVIEAQRKRILLLEDLVRIRTQLLNEKSELIEDYKWNEYYASLEKKEASEKAKANTNISGFVKSLDEGKKASWLPIQALHNDTPVTIRVWAVL